MLACDLAELKLFASRRPLTGFAMYGVHGVVNPAKQQQGVWVAGLRMRMYMGKDIIVLPSLLTRAQLPTNIPGPSKGCDLAIPYGVHEVASSM